MRSFTLLSIITFSLPALAHFELKWPTARGFNEDTLASFPCGGQDTVSSSRTRVSPTGFSLHLLMGHDQTAISVVLGLGNDPAPNFNITVLPTFREEGLGDFCLETVSVAGVDGMTANSLNGMNATLQVITNGDSQPAGGLYNCADITFADTGDDSPPAGSCQNNTGVRTNSLSTTLTANETTAQGDPQEGSSSSSSPSGTSSAGATAASSSPTGAAAMANAGWGLMGAAALGAMAFL